MHTCPVSLRCLIKIYKDCDMCAATLLQTILAKSCGFFMHKKRLATLTELCCSLIKCASLTMTKLGNQLSEMNKISERHSIKRVSNFLSNRNIQRENSIIQAVLAKELLSNFTVSRIIVDWTPASERSHYVLRANLICKNSSIVLYQETYLEKKVNNTKIQNRFLKRLHTMIPKHITKVLIITDAGFKGEWFKQVENLKWNFCGRVRGETCIKLDNQEWQQAKTFARKATAHIRYLGKGLLAKRNEHEMYMYSYKQSLKAIKKKSQRNNPNACTELKRQIRSYTEGWFIVTNLTKVNENIKKIVIKHYNDRMKIEASNRTTKSTKYGFGLEDTMTRDIERIKILLLIEQIVSFVAWLVGAYKEETRTDREFMNGSRRSSRRLSLVNLGIRALKRKETPLFEWLMDMLTQLARLEVSLC